MYSRVDSANVKDLFQFSKTVNRAGVIPYSIFNNRIYWLMGITYHGQWSDFGGGCKSSKGESPYLCLLREATEETNGLLTEEIKMAIEKDEDLFTWVAYTKNDVIADYIIMVPIVYQEYKERFRPNSEIANLVWIPQSTIFNPQIQMKHFHPPLHRYIRAFRKHARSHNLISN